MGDPFRGADPPQEEPEPQMGDPFTIMGDPFTKKWGSVFLHRALLLILIYTPLD